MNRGQYAVLTVLAVLIGFLIGALIAEAVEKNRERRQTELQEKIQTGQPAWISENGNIQIGRDVIVIIYADFTDRGKALRRMKKDLKKERADMPITEKLAKKNPGFGIDNKSVWHRILPKILESKGEV